MFGAFISAPPTSAAGPGRPLPFPPDFLWGTGTSPTQVEGHITNEWTNYVARDGRTCHPACDSYHRYPEDIEWMVRLGVKGYRLGLEWSRLQAGPFEALNAAELDRYLDQLDRLKQAGIVPMVVLHHFSNPLWITGQDGWLNRATVAAFVDYATKLAAALRGRVRLWNTFNEPDTYASCTYLIGEFPPEHKWRFNAYRRVIAHMADAHGQVCRRLRQLGSEQGPVEVGFSKNWTSFEAYHAWSPWDRLLAALSHELFNRFVLRSFMRGSRREAATFLGVNYYGRVRFQHTRPLIPTFGFARERLARMGVICDDMFERHPDGMAATLLKLQRRHRLPIYVTEHGSASTDEAFREQDLRDNLRALHGAIQRGVDVRGFFYWSLLDNFEWQFGYAKKFGLVGVDFADAGLPRAMKPLGLIYSQICRDNALNDQG
jgi:beta-glucosidase